MVSKYYAANSFFFLLTIFVLQRKFRLVDGATLRVVGVGGKIPVRP